MANKARIRLSSTDPQGLNSICSEIMKIADRTGVKLRAQSHFQPRGYGFQPERAHVAKGHIHGIVGKCESINA